MVTTGISPKAIAALAWPLVVALSIAVGSWVETGQFNDTEVRTAIAGVIASIVSFIGAYVAPPGEVK